MQNKPRIVQKFGGTSVGTPDRILSVVDIVRTSTREFDPIVAVSALSPRVKSEGTTSLLLESVSAAVGSGDYLTPLEKIRDCHLETLFKVGGEDETTSQTQIFIERTLDGLEHFLDAIRVIKEISPRSYDATVAVGELLSARLLATALQINGVMASFIDLSHICPITYKDPVPEFWEEARNQIAKVLEPNLAEHHVPVVTGFLGPVPGGIIDAVGRGYTDHTAALSAAAVGAQELQIWKEVDGVFTADPSVVSQATVLEVLTPEEASEITYFGSEVIHPMTMQRAIDAGIPLRVKNTFKPDFPGTVISDDATPSTSESPIRCVTSKDNITVLHVRSNRMFDAYGFLAKLFHIMDRHGVVVDLVTTSEVSVSMTIEESENLIPLVTDLETLGEVSVQSGMSIVSVVGEEMRGTIGLAARVFGCLGEAGINIEMISQGASKMNISCVVVQDLADKAVCALHKGFFESVESTAVAGQAEEIALESSLA